MDKKTKILIVDDEKLIGKALGDHLRRKGYEVEIALDGEEGLAKVKKFMPDLIMLDIIMPKMDGITLLNILKKDSTTSAIPVIMSTNLESKESVAEAAELGNTGYLIKANYSLDEVTKKIEETIKR